MTDDVQTYVQALALRLDGTWRRRTDDERHDDGCRFLEALAYSFGLDGQDFVVAYETDDLVAFGDLVRALRATESRRSTVDDQPILLGIHRPLDEILELLGAA